MAIRLATVAYGAGGTPLAILHGLFGAGRNWAGIAQRLAERRRVVALDLRNHGASPWADRIDYAAMADDVLTTMTALGYPRYALLGHSMGGKAAMLAALRHGEAVARLIVVDIAPVTYPASHLAYAQAMQQLDLAAIRRRGDADVRLAAAVPDDAERAFLLQNLVFEPGQAPRWRLNLAAIERAMPALAGFPVPTGAEYRGPALFVAGGRSDYLSAEHEAAIRRLFPAADVARIADAGHWPHAEQPQRFLEIVAPFLAGAD
jgi:pimeloyl-ACP methyl ester carboxylesterase